MYILYYTDIFLKTCVRVERRFERRKISTPGVLQGVVRLRHTPVRSVEAKTIDEYDIDAEYECVRLDRALAQICDGNKDTKWPDCIDSQGLRKKSKKNRESETQGFGGKEPSARWRTGKIQHSEAQTNFNIFL